MEPYAVLDFSIYISDEYPLLLLLRNPEDCSN
jgi:hypothetical protein